MVGTEKTIAIRIDEDLHKRIKFRLAEKGITLKEYIIGLIEEDLDNPSNGPTRQELLLKIERARKALDQCDLDQK